MSERRRITKRRIAEKQLCRAVDVLVNGNDPISALTLAGAAEEILGKMVEANGKSNAFEESAEAGRQLWELVVARSKGDFFKGLVPDEKQIRQGINFHRNEVKHNSSGKNGSVTADFAYHAEEMILRAIRNYELLYDKLPRNNLLAEWYEDITL
jgi:hypothetical protein